MEGNLFKWTNYWKGWQLRWFILKDGVLSYYNSENESNNGDCKGSFKICVFDIIVNKNDPTRMDLIIPNEQNLYLKASDYKERQKWLVALASQKATHPSTSFPPGGPNDLPLDSPLKSPSSTFLPTDKAQPLSGTYDSTYFLKIKQSELRLYCDLLTQQTHDLKNLILTINKSSNNETSKTASDQSTKLNPTKTTLIIPNDNVSILSSSFKSFTNLCDEASTLVNRQEHDNVSGVTNFQSINNEPLDNEQTDTQSALVKESNLIDKSVSNNIDISSDTVKKMDDMSSNINITCDMLIQIIRNLIVLSNTSTNISPEAVKSLLNETESNSAQAQSQNISVDLDQYKYHLYHPLYLNQHLNQYKTKNIPIATSSQTNNKSHNAKQKADSESQSLSSSPSRLSTKSLPFNLLFDQQHQNALTSDNNNEKDLNNNNMNFTNLNTKQIARKSYNHYRKDMKLPNIHRMQLSRTSTNNSISGSLASILSNRSLISDYHIESLKETALVAHVEPVVEDINNNHIHKESNPNMIESTSSETIVVSSTSGPFQSLTIVSESHKSAKSFFTLINHRFTDIVLLEENGIPTEYFLNCCSDMFSLLDSFGSTAFLPVKIDVYGNINKIKQKYSIDPQKYRSLQSIVQHEIEEKQTHARNSATDALMWLRRAIWFLREFLHEFSKKHDSDMGECVNISYQNTLKQYHNFVVRSIFSLAMRSLPSKDEFFKRLIADHTIYMENKERFEKQIIEEMRISLKGIDLVLNLIRDFYHKNKLET